MLTDRDCMLLEGVQRFPDVYRSGYNFPYEILGRRLTLKEAQAELGVNIDITKDYPFGDMDTREKLFFMRIKKGDEIREFRTADSTWKYRCGRAGVALVRNGKIINGILTTIS
ncbi:MAG TPA: hypothetical protein VI728_03560 [Syntrophales bacterium]|nr:MAG: hypothetical protein A2Z28_05545 [Chloroflexi bacterium RBG_16_51_9]HLE17344.1 hypothetical protein [Syntrophales bacterium]